MQHPFCSAMVAIGYVYSHAGLATLLLCYKEWRVYSCAGLTALLLCFYENLVWGRAHFAYFLDLAALLLCYEYPVQGLLCLWFISNGGCWLCSFPCGFDCSAVVL